jgi:hypothetical protein
MKNAEDLTHYVQYQDKKGGWRDGFLGYTLDEAKEIARIGAKRTGRPTRIRPIPTTDTN